VGGVLRGRGKSDPANPFVVSVDMALRHDSVAVSRIEKLPDRRFAITSRIWRPEAGPVDHLDVFNYIRDQARGLDFRGVVYDPRFFELPGRMLEDEGILAIQFDQSPQRMAPACGLAYDLILDRRIVHDGDPELAAHVKGAVKREQDRGFTLSKGKSKRHIDAAITLCMGVWILHDPEKPPPLDPSFAPAEGRRSYSETATCSALGSKGGRSWLLTSPPRRSVTSPRPPARRRAAGGCTTGRPPRTVVAAVDRRL
jgi:hypothetical protein